MTIVGSSSQHGVLELPPQVESERFEGIRGTTSNDHLLDMIDYFVGQHESRGLLLDAGLAIVTKEEDGSNWVTWSLILPNRFSRGEEGISRRRAISLMETPDHRVYADETTLVFSQTGRERKIDDFKSLTNRGRKVLRLVELKLEGWLLEDHPLPQ